MRQDQYGIDRGKVRRLHATGAYTSAILAERFGVSTELIWHIVNGDRCGMSEAAKRRWQRGRP